MPGFYCFLMAALSLRNMSSQYPIETYIPIRLPTYLPAYLPAYLPTYVW